MAHVKDEDIPVLKITGLSKNYGGLQVLADIHVEIRTGELHALIGSNGAGKTTLFDIVCGFIRPSRGSIKFMGREITSLPAFKYAHLGIGRTFQITTLFRTLTVLDNLRLSLEALPATRLPFMKSGAFSERNIEPVIELLKPWGLWETRNVPVAALPYGVQRQLEIVMALIQKPRLLLLDEPTAGMGDEETRQITALVRRLHRDKNCTIVLIEHDMRVVFHLADRITVLDQGMLLAEGDPQQIAANDAVQAAYLGKTA